MKCTQVNNEWYLLNELSSGPTFGLCGHSDLSNLCLMKLLIHASCVGDIERRLSLIHGVKIQHIKQISSQYMSVEKSYMYFWDILHA